MLFAKEFLHIFFFFVGVFDVFSRVFEKGGGVVVSTCSVLAIMYVSNTNLQLQIQLLNETTDLIKS